MLTSSMTTGAPLFTSLMTTGAPFLTPRHPGCLGLSI
jgi:hypothetical protein